MAIAGRASREMRQHYSRIRQEARWKAVAAWDNVTILAQLMRRQLPAGTTGKRQIPKKEREISGRGGGIRTPDPLLPKQMRYQTALRPDVS